MCYVFYRLRPIDSVIANWNCWLRISGLSSSRAAKGMIIWHPSLIAFHFLRITHEFKIASKRLPASARIKTKSKIPELEQKKARIGI